MTTNRPDYIPHSRSSRRAYRGIFNRAAQLHLEIEPRWRESFGHFLNDMGIRPEGTILARRDRNQGFTPSNCTWQPIPAAPEPAAV